MSDLTYAKICHLENAGIPVLLNSDWQELTLLGRAEWVKMLAVLLNKEKEVNEFFNRIEQDYNTTYKLVTEKFDPFGRLSPLNSKALKEKS